VYGDNGNSDSTGYAGYFNGRIKITKSLAADGDIVSEGTTVGRKGIVGTNASGPGVQGTSSVGNGAGVWGVANSGTGAIGVYGSSTSGDAGYFEGKVHVNGALSKSSGSFKIDHPLDPANKYLYHSFVESPDMMNIYNGVVVLDKAGEATIALPEWFEALNRDFRYQLTCIGGFAPVFVAGEISGNRFRVAGGREGLRVSWQVTGVRKDAYAEAHRIQVEEDKAESERGFYLHPELFGAPEEQGIEWVHHPELMLQAKQAREAAAATR